MKAIIIDDEPKARSLLHEIVQGFCPDITDVQEAEDLPSGVDLIKSTKPDLIFLDIEMPEYSGTQIFDFFEKDTIDFHIIFTTAYSEFALQAFEMNAIDYLLKPMRPNKVKEAVAKAKNKMKTENISSQLEELKLNFQSAMFQKIGLPIADGILFIELEHLIMMEADGMYTKVFTKNNGSQIISKPLKFFVDLLANNSLFYRPHRSFLLNIKHIKQYVRKDGNYIIMSNEMIVSISKEKRDEFLEIVSSI
jgi:two-component system LytT family response regulator